MKNKMANPEAHISYYVHQFGRIRYKGGYYLICILRNYVANPTSLDAEGCKQFIEKIASEKGVTPETVKRAIKRYVLDGSKALAGNGKNIPDGVQKIHQIVIRLSD